MIQSTKSLLWNNLNVPNFCITSYDIVMTTSNIDDDWCFTAAFVHMAG